MEEIKSYHSLAKDAGNKLRAYILSMSTGATGVFFLALTKSDVSKFTQYEKWLLLCALIAFVTTVAICLYELRIDAKRFFDLAKELEKPQENQQWFLNEKYKKLRYKLIHSSYFTLGFGMLCISIYLALNIFKA